MSPTTALLTVDEFVCLPDEETWRSELIGGEIVPMANAGAIHERVKANVNQTFVLWVAERRIGLIFVETFFGINPTEGFTPDVSLILFDQLPEHAVAGPMRGSPALIVEVVSSEPASKLRHKLDAYFEGGTRVALVLYPDFRILEVHRPDGVSRTFREGQDLELPDLLPGFKVPVSRLFEGI